MTRLSLIAPIAIVLLTGCRDDAEPGASPPMDEAFPAGCAAPSNGTEVTCANLCEKLARCTVGLCAQQTGDDLFCAPETYAGLHASCMAGCIDDALAADASTHECVLASSCGEAFVDKKCTPDVELSCTASSDESSSTEACDEHTSTTTGDDEYTSSTTGYYGSDSSSSTSYGDTSSEGTSTSDESTSSEASTG
jgi:hypothetical protein